MTSRSALTLLVSAAAALSACSSAGMSSGNRHYNDTASNPAICMLSPFSRTADGTVAKADMEAGIKAGFIDADTNGDGKLNYDELARLNEQHANSCDISPFRDWSGTGLIDLNDYASRYRTAFTQCDTNADGFATRDELIRYHRDAPKKKTKAPPSEQTPEPSTGIPGQGIPGQGNSGSPY